MEYLDFIVRIEAKRGEVFDVGIESPAGEGTSELRLPYDSDQLIALMGSLGQNVRGSRDVVTAVQGPANGPPSDVGGALFQSLFTGSCRDLFNTSLGQIHGGGREVGLRIKLHIDPADPDVADLAGIPWELMYRAETHDYLTLSRATPLVRYLDVQRPFSLLPFTPPLRILVAVSSPVGAPPLDLEDERKAIRGSWGRSGGVAVDFLDRVTTRQLSDTLAAKPYDVLHFMGHGDFAPEKGTGVLLLEDERGREARIDGATLGILLRDVKTMRLVFLNACNTAKLATRAGMDPFAGVATALVMAGVPAVVAMQFPVSDPAAIVFAGTFYPRLAGGDPIDAAVSEGRKAMRVADAQTWEWATPVLFMRSKDGVLFDTPALDSVEAEPTTYSPGISDVAPGRLVSPASPETTHRAAADLADRVAAMKALEQTFAPERNTYIALIGVAVLVILLTAWLALGTGGTLVWPATLTLIGGASSAAVFLFIRLLTIPERTMNLVRELATSPGALP